jgi:hypothetical protein
MRNRARTGQMLRCSVRAFHSSTAIIATAQTLATLKTKAASSFQNAAIAMQPRTKRCHTCTRRCHTVSFSRAILRETRVFAADNLAILRRDKENRRRFHRLAIGHRKKLRPARQVGPQGSPRPAAIRQPRIVVSSRSGAWVRMRWRHACATRKFIEMADDVIELKAPRREVAANTCLAQPP